MLELSTGYIFVYYVLYETRSLRQIITLPITFSAPMSSLGWGVNACKTIAADISMKLIFFSGC